MLFRPPGYRKYLRQHQTKSEHTVHTYHRRTLPAISWQIHPRSALPFRIHQKFHISCTFSSIRNDCFHTLLSPRKTPSHSRFHYITDNFRPESDPAYPASALLFASLFDPDLLYRKKTPDKKAAFRQMRSTVQ